MNTIQVDVLGTTYTIYPLKNGDDASADRIFDQGCDGYTDTSTKEIMLLDKEPDANSCANLEEVRKCTLRHELVHAFLYESGLGFNSSRAEEWATNEEMVDWFAIQSPKLLKAFKEAKCL